MSCCSIGFITGIYHYILPLIEAINAKTADQTRTIVLPEGDAFTAYDGKLNAGVVDFYTANNGAGAAITGTANSYGGLITVMVGVDAKGAITGVKVMAHTDTPGLGTKAMTPEYLKQYIGKTSADIVEGQDGDTIKNNKNLDAITGATISSNGIYHSVQTALKQFDAAGGVK